MKKKILIALTLLFFGVVVLIANTAQPGIHSAGGTGSFTLLFPEDSTSFKKIQMQKELVSIQLYQGFAVVKGEYWMYNSTDEVISIKTGYPINAQYFSRKNASDHMEIFFDKLFKMSVSIDSQIVGIEKIEYETADPKIYPVEYNENPKWYIWTTTFKPGAITKIEVFFIVNTNDSNISRGYNRESFNGFIYVLETGASWKPPIEQGSIRVQLKDGLTVDDIKGVAPSNVFNYNEFDNFLSYDFKNLLPTHEDNLVITYSKRLENFDFENVVSQSDTYFKAIDSFSKTDIGNATSNSIEFNSPFDISNSGNVFVWIIFLVIYGLPVLGGIALVYIIYRIVKRMRKK